MRLLLGLEGIKRRILAGSLNEPWGTHEIESVVLLSGAVTTIVGTELRVATTNLLQAVRKVASRPTLIS